MSTSTLAANQNRGGRVRRRSATARRLLEIGAAAAVIVVAIVWLVRARTAAHESPYRLETAAVARGPLQAKVTATGTANPIVTVQVGSQVSGTIIKLGADFNSAVAPGMMIAQIDPRLFKVAAKQAEASLQVARSNLHKARAQLLNDERLARRTKELLARKLIAPQDAETAETAVTVDRAQVEAAQASEALARAALEQARLNLEYTTIQSPIAGTVITRNVDVGQTVAASFAAPTLFVIGQDLKKMQIDTNIAEADVGRLAPGMAATFTVDAYPGETFQGRIREVRSSPQTIQNVVTYDAVIDVDNSGLKLKPGMTANLTVICAERKDVLKVANAALRFHSPAEWSGKDAAPLPANQKQVWVVRGGEPASLRIRTGITDGSASEVLAGDLAPGDQVIIEAISTRPAGGGM
jgi:HlyD family secretion protein